MRKRNFRGGLWALKDEKIDEYSESWKNEDLVQFEIRSKREEINVAVVLRLQSNIDWEMTSMLKWMVGAWGNVKNELVVVTIS